MRSLLFSLFLCGSLCTFAQGMTATLQHGENTKFFYGYQSFAEAYENAENGDVITLSKGNFNTIDCIEKSVSVIGNFAFSANEECTVLSDIKVSADNVCLSGIRVTGSLRMALSNNLQIKRCYVQNLRADTTHTRTLIEDCAINNDFSLPWGIDESYRRSEIFRYHKANTPENMANFEYCTIYNPAIEEIDVKYVHGLKSFKNQLASYGTYRNCAISSHVSVQNNLSYLYFNKQSDYKDILIFGGENGRILYNIPEGTQAVYVTGKFGYPDNFKDNFPLFYTDEIVIPQEPGLDYKALVGCVGHKHYPAIPRVVDCNIDRETTADGKLGVAVKVIIED